MFHYVIHVLHALFVKCMRVWSHAFIVIMIYLSLSLSLSLLADTNADHDITNTLMHVIWSLGQVFPDYNHNPGSGIEARTAMNRMFYKPDEIKYHGSVNRGATTLNFFGKKKEKKRQ